MDDANGVRGSERTQHLDHHVDDRADRRQSLEHVVAERLAVEELHHDHGPAIGKTEQIVDAHDVVVRDHVDRARLCKETVGEIRIACVLFVEYLDCDAAADLALYGGVDAPHPALAEEMRDLVAADRDADERVVR